MRFRSFLRQLALDSPHLKYGHAAVVAKGKAVRGIGVNRQVGLRSLHAEADAIEQAFRVGANLDGCTLYTLMVRKASRTVGDGSPCPDCMAAMKAAGVRRVVVYL